MVLPSMPTVVSTEIIVTRTVTERKIDPVLEITGTVMVLTHFRQIILFLTIFKNIFKAKTYPK